MKEMPSRCLISYFWRRLHQPAFPIMVLLMLGCFPRLTAKNGLVDVTGTWDMTVETQGGTGHPSIILQQSGEKITGTYQGQMGNSKLDGTIKGSDINFSVTLKFQDVPYAVTYTGTVSDDSMKGTANFGDAGTGSWSAKRRKK